MKRGTLRSRQKTGEKIQALSLAKECYSMKLDLLTNATVVDDAIRFVSEKSKDKVKDQVKSSPSSPSGSSNNEDDKESKEPDYNYDNENSDKEGEEKQEKIGEITAKSLTLLTFLPIIRTLKWTCHQR